MKNSDQQTTQGRFLSDSHIEAYKNGVFKKLFQAINEDPELSLEIRLNDTAIVYYHKGKILTTSIDPNGKPKVNMLDKQYYSNSSLKKPSSDIENIDNLNNIEIIRKYFNIAKRLVYLYKIGEEFTFQQNTALGNHSFDSRYLVIDMEWQFSQSQIKKEDRIGKTRIDLIIVDNVKNESGYNDIYLAELKSGIKATEGTSGVIDHVNKTYKIICNQNACDSLITDVTNIIDIKSQLGIFKGTKKDYNFAKKPKMMLICSYRGDLEKQKLEGIAQEAIIQAKKINMEEPKCILHNALIQL